MNKSESIKDLAKALQQFSIKMDKIAKTSENPFFKSKYAALPDILEAIKLPLSECGLAVAQFPDGDGLTTIIMHESGQWIEATAIMHPVKNDPQAAGSAITYQRRYSLGAILCLNIDEDDDGNKASLKEKEEPKQDKPWLNVFMPEFANVKQMVDRATDKQAAIKAARATWAISKAVEQELLK